MIKSKSCDNNKFKLGGENERLKFIIAYINFSSTKLRTIVESELKAAGKSVK